MQAPCGPQVYSVNWDPLTTVPIGRGASGGGAFRLLPQALEVCDTSNNEYQAHGTVCMQ